MEVDVSTQPVAGHSSFRIHWIVQGIFGSERDGFTSELATNRYRAIIPAQQLRMASHLVDFIAADGWQWGSGSRPDLIILGKLLSSGSAHDFSRISSQVLTQARRAIADGVPVIADFNDDHFNHPVLGPHWIQAASIATLCTAASQAMADVVQRFTRSPVIVIPDPIASPTGTPRVFHPTVGIARLLSRWAPGLDSKRLKLVWYGHPSNWPPMESWGNALETFSKDCPLVLWVLTKPTPRINIWIDQFNSRNSPNAIAECVEWSEDVQWSYVRDADAVLLPSDQADARFVVKSNNRLSDALNVGRYVVASALPSYQPFGAYCSLTSDPLEALQWMVKNPKGALRMISDGQAYVKELSSVTAVARKWREASMYASQLTDGQKSNVSFVSSNDRRPVTETDPCTAVPDHSSLERRADPTSDGTKVQTQAQSQAQPSSSSMLPTLLDLHMGKSGKVSDKWEAYFPAYERLFGPLRDRAINLLEIGVQNGGSLEVWAEYFAKAPHIVGCDIDPRCANLRYSDPRITVVVGDAASKDTHNVIAESCKSFDIVIDDGSHLSDDIVRTFLIYFSSLNPGGIYLVEDTHALYSAVVGGGVLSGNSAHQFFKQCAELTNFEHWKYQLRAETLMSTFIPRGEDFPKWLTLGTIESVEFRNSMVVIRKARDRSLLGRRVIGGQEASVNPKVLAFKHHAYVKSMQIDTEQESDSLTGRSAVENQPTQLALLTLQSSVLPSVVMRLIEPLSLDTRYRLEIASQIVNGSLAVDYRTLSESRIVIVHRDFPRSDTIELLKTLISSGKKMVYDTDDAFHLIPETHPKAYHLRNAPYMLEAASLANALVCSTHYLSSQYPNAKQTFVIPNLLSPRLWNESLIGLCREKSREIRIGLLGGNNHRDDFLAIRDAIWQLSESFPNVCWVAYGEGALQALQGLPRSQIETVVADYNYQLHPKRLAALGLQMVLAPLKPEEFNRCISNIKFLEASFLGIPGVYADLEPYNNTINHGIDGFLASSSQSTWVELASRLIQDPETRQFLGSRARAKVLESFLLNEANRAWNTVLSRLQ